VFKEKGRTPLIMIQVPGTVADTVLMYGHLDKQPPMWPGWNEGLGPYTPVVRSDKLYGRGGADDGYAVFAAITALGAVRAQGLAHARAVIVIEACEESGLPDLPSTRVQPQGQDRHALAHRVPRLGLRRLRAQ